jgi:predicted phosphodiesterase
VEIEHRGVGPELVDELDCCQPVRCRGDDGEVTLALDQTLEVLEKAFVVVGEHHSNRALGSVGAHTLQPLASGPPGQGLTIAIVLGVLYDIHGNLPALERVLDEAGSLDIDRWLLGGDYGTPSPWPEETIGRLKELPNATWIRGNGERWLREPPTDRPEVMEVYELFAGALDDELVDWLYGLPTEAELDGILYVHGSPLSDVDSFHPTREDDDERLLDGVRDRTVVFGHSHQQFRRPGPDGTHLLNPGSVGMPLDGDVRAAWATWDGDFELRRTEYDVAKGAAGYRSLGGDFAEFMATRIERGSD